jgi:hypothetical protein
MKHYFTLFILVFFFQTKSQTYPSLNSFYNEIPTSYALFDSAVAANHYHNVTRAYTRFNKKGKAKKKTRLYSFKYDEKGFVTAFEEGNSKNKNKEHYEYVIADSLLVKYDYYRKNELKKTYEIKRNPDKRISDFIVKNNKGEVISKKHHDFDPETKLINRVAIYGKHNKERQAIEYTYFDAKNMKQAREYRKGKLKKIWNYTCDPAGFKEEKVKEIKVCKNVNVDENGNRVETNRIVTPKGKIELRINTFDKNNQMIRQLIYDDLKHKLESEWSYTYVNGNMERIYKTYNRRGKEDYYNKTMYDTSGHILSNEYVIGTRKRDVFKTYFTYNDKKLITHSESFDKKNRKTSENIHTYN